MSGNLANPNIKHVFVLILENRSFDHMLGLSGITGTDAATGKPTTINGTSTVDQNSYNGKPYPVVAGADLIMPFDPSHEFPDVVQQLCGQGAVYNGGAYPAPNNSGFVADYAATIQKANPAATSFGEIMKCYTPDQLPILNQLASEFCVCDNWHAALPGPTWPNRFFIHAASSGGLDHSPTLPEIGDWSYINGFEFPKGNIYHKLSAAGKSWRLYRGRKSPLIGSIPIVAALKGIQIRDTNHYDQFATDIQEPYPYDYTFIEPNYGDIVNNSYSGGQSQHPMDNVLNGEALIQSTYEAIRNSPIWENSLLIIAYDEHGGFYDHVTPPQAPVPGDTLPHQGYNQYGFLFDRYGVRVPAVIISAYTPKNTISHLTYDHTSVPATLEAMFGLGSLTARDSTANTVTGLASLNTARTDTPARLQAALPAPAPAPPPPDVSVPAPNELVESADKGNLPGFLHVVMKARAAEEPPETHPALVFEISQEIKTKADARNYLNRHLPEFSVE
jgi:phospholipase C